MAQEPKGAVSSRKALSQRLREIGARLIKETEGQMGRAFYDLHKKLENPETCPDNWQSIDAKIVDLLNQMVQDLREKDYRIIQADFPKLEKLVEERVDSLQAKPLEEPKAEKTLSSRLSVFLFGDAATTDLTLGEDFENLSPAELEQLKGELDFEISKIHRDMVKQEHIFADIKQNMKSILEKGREAHKAGNTIVASRLEMDYKKLKKDQESVVRRHGELRSIYEVRSDELRALGMYIQWRKESPRQDISGLRDAYIAKMDDREITKEWHVQHVAGLNLEPDSEGHQYTGLFGEEVEETEPADLPSIFADSEPEWDEMA